MVEITKYLSNDSRVLSRDFKPGLPEHEAEVLTNSNATFCCIHLLGLFFTPEYGGICSPETSVNFYRRYILEKSALHRPC